MSTVLVAEFAVRCAFSYLKRAEMNKLCGIFHAFISNATNRSLINGAIYHFWPRSNFLSQWPTKTKQLSATNTKGQPKSFTFFSINSKTNKSNEKYSTIYCFFRKFQPNSFHFCSVEDFYTRDLKSYNNSLHLGWLL